MAARIVFFFCLACYLVVFVSSEKSSAFVNPSSYRTTKFSSKRGICQATTLKRKEIDPDDDDSPPLPWPPLELRQKDYTLAKNEVFFLYFFPSNRNY